MVTDDQIDTLHNTVRDRVNEIVKVQHCLNLIRLLRPEGQPTSIPRNPIKYVEYTQTERDAIYADAETEIARIKASL